MQTVMTTTARPASAQRSQPKTAPVKVWASLGVAFLALQVYALSAWIISGKATHTPTGPDPVPTWLTVSNAVWMTILISAFVAIVYFAVVRPWRRGQGLTNDALLALVFLLIWWQDPLCLWFSNWVSYNSALPNLGSWTTNMPGWIAPHSNLMGEPLLLTPPGYMLYGFGGAVVACWFTRKAKARWPELSRFALFMTCWGAATAFDVILETLWLRMGIYTYGGAPNFLLLFPGKYYQFPLIEAGFAGLLLAGWGWIRYTRDDKGLTAVERGADELRLSHQLKKPVRFLALLGAANTVFFVLYNIPMAIFGLYSQDWPKAIQEKSYFTSGLCGPGTNYACGGPGLPLPKRNSSHIDPAGHLSTDNRGGFLSSKPE